ncbi:ATP-binding cassette domain-containing protein [Desulfogranum marinum]|uniref:ATP-binding cassette domain-containing protein n=1 Tax=Desulfogranum marinum TaxID=453220 RepID=UPI0019665791|nr:ATP-binding cassette domain-containing protein [Desulfogranum marinum]MBM9510989.1 ATP-binding cassette domain-containing protein [Desulfogranum marinum]
MALQVKIQKQLRFFNLEVSLTCAPGTLTAIVGPSGAGKSTLIRIISGLDRPDSGTISFGDKYWNDCSMKLHVTPQDRKVSLVFQEYTLFPHLTVRQNIVFGAKNDNGIDELLEQFGIIHVAHRKPASISGGERQRAAFCQALARDPVLLLLDEPFSALDRATRELLRKKLSKLKQDLHIPIVHITHDLKEAHDLADNIYVMESGKASPQWLEQYAPYDAPPSVENLPRKTWQHPEAAVPKITPLTCFNCL